MVLKKRIPTPLNFAEQHRSLGMRGARRPFKGDSKDTGWFVPLLTFQCIERLLGRIRKMPSRSGTDSTFRRVLVSAVSVSGQFSRLGNLIQFQYGDTP
ncbi:hypothetical protein ACVWZX_005343 [Deinococcus sp. UYEF24]